MLWARSCWLDAYHLPAAAAPPPVGGAVAAPSADHAGPVRNQAAQPGDEIVTIRYWKIKKGAFPEFLKASETGVWPYFEKIGARVVGMWQVIPAPGSKEASADYDEVYLTTRYASLDHWAATRDAAKMGGDGPDYAALQAALAVRRSLTIETKDHISERRHRPVAACLPARHGERHSFRNRAGLLRAAFRLQFDAHEVDGNRPDIGDGVRAFRSGPDGAVARRRLNFVARNLRKLAVLHRELDIEKAASPPPVSPVMTLGRA